MRPGLVAATALLVSAVGISTWLGAAEYATIPSDVGRSEASRSSRGGSLDDIRFREPADWVLTGPDAERARRDLIRRATFVLPGVDLGADAVLSDPLRAVVPGCRLLPSEPSGTTPKFDCVFADGEVVKVKYGNDAEIHAEAAATALLRMLGYPADTVTIVPRLRCYGCPRHPFVAMHLRRSFHLPFIPEQIDDGFTDFQWVSLERKFPAPAIETDTVSGWEWRDLDASDAPRPEVDAFRVLAAFLAHWDNKSTNQRLVCMDSIGRDRPSSNDEHVVDVSGPPSCRQPVAMIQDLGGSFGPPKVNLARWRDLPVWHDRTTCTLSMRALPFEGATFEDVRISEAGRALAAERLQAISDLQIERLFADARFPQFQVGTDDARDLRAWTQAFKSRVKQIAEARCSPMSRTAETLRRGE
jgi:hypothetical protein